MKIPDVVLQEASETMEMLEGTLVYLGKIGDGRDVFLFKPIDANLILSKYYKFFLENQPKSVGTWADGYGSGTGIQILIVAEGVEDVGIIVLLVVLELVDGHELASLLDDETLDTSLVEDDVLVWFPVDLVVLREHEAERSDVHSSELAIGLKEHEVVPRLVGTGEDVRNEHLAIRSDHTVFALDVAPAGMVESGERVQ